MAELFPDNLLAQIKKGECSTVEFKRARKALPNNIFETICGMLNRNGGHIFLGVEDDGKIIDGVDKDSINQIKKDFANLCNNPQKIFPTIRVEMYDYLIDNKFILHIYIYESSDVHKTAGKIFDRSEDGDYDITNNTHLVSQAYIRKSSTYIENKIYPYAKISDLRSDLIERARKLASNNTAGHPWAAMSDEELLKSAGLYDRNLQTGEEGINLAGILLLGKDKTILSALSYYRTDAILRVEDTDRYDDRDDIRTNLLDSYDRLMAFFRKHTNAKFYIEKDQRINIRDIMARELCANMLIHREYSNPTTAQLIISSDSIRTTNANKPRFVGYIDASSFSPFPKNPKIAGFFKEIGYADELGSGIKKISKYSSIYSGREPIFKEDETFTATIFLPRGDGAEGKIRYRELILEFITRHAGATRKEINDYIYPLMEGYAEAQKAEKVHNIIASLSRNGVIENRGSNKRPEWYLLKNTIKTQ